jgi:antitoxin ParD1/3/4
MNTGRNFSITERQSRFVDAQVEAGRHASASEVVREALRRYEDDLAAEHAAVAALEAVAAEGAAAIAAGDFALAATAEEARALFATVGREAAADDDGDGQRAA